MMMLFRAIMSPFLLYCIILSCLLSSSSAFISAGRKITSPQTPLTCLSATKKSASKTTSRQNRIQSLLEWAKSADIQAVGALQLQSDPVSGLGWFAKDALTKGQVLLTVPSDVALTIEAPGEGPDDRGVLKLVSDKRALRDLPWYVQMAAYLYKLDQKDSTKQDNVSLRPWLDSLPRQFDTPIHWSQEALKELQYDYIMTSIQKQERDWKAYHQRLQQQAGLTTISWKDFLWGCECARSRAFSGAYTGSAFNPLIYAFTLLLVTLYVGLNIGTLEQAANGAGVVVSAAILKDFVLPKLFKKKRYVICPMIDMANHKSVGYTGNVSFEYFGNAYSLALDDNVQKDAQVFISYGSRSNDQLLQYYGFCETDNPNDIYVMPPLREWDIDALEKATGRQFAPGRLEKLDRAGLLGSSANLELDDTRDEEASNLAGGVVLTRVLGIDPAILQALRALVSSDYEWEAAGQAIGNFAEEGSGGPENERLARLAACTAVEMELKSKRTSLKEDEELLQKMETMKSLDAGIEEKLAVMFRVEKKKLLLETIGKLQ